MNEHGRCPVTVRVTGCRLELHDAHPSLCLSYDMHQSDYISALNDSDKAILHHLDLTHYHLVGGNGTELLCAYHPVLLKRYIIWCYYMTIT